MNKHYGITKELMKSVRAYMLINEKTFDECMMMLKASYMNAVDEHKRGDYEVT